MLYELPEHLTTPEQKERFIANTVRYNGLPCWCWNREWPHSTRLVHYIGGRNYSARRASYCLFVGRIPDGTVILPACKNPLCVRPSHLVVVPKRETKGWWTGYVSM